MSDDDKSLEDLLAELGDSGDDSASSSASDDTSLDDLLKSLGGDDTPSADSGDSESSDDDLDSLLAGLGGDDDSSSSSSSDSDSSSGGDSDLDSLLAGLDGDDDSSASSSDDSSFDDSSDSSDEDSPAPAAPPREAPKASTGSGVKPSLSATLGVRSAPKAHPGSKQPLVIALIGDFTGRVSRGVVEPLADRKGYLVDLDSHDELYEKLSPTLTIEDPGAPGTKVELTFNELDDFHPDQFYKKFPGIQNLRTLRPQLLSSASLAKAAAQLQKLLGTPLPKAPRRSSGARPGETTEQTLERLLKKKPAAKKGAAPAAKASTATQAVEALIKQAVADNVVKNPTAHQQQLVAALDAACAVRLRAILSNPRFQALESAWRSIDMLVRLFDDGDRIKLLVYDVSKEEIAFDLTKNGDNPTETELHKMIRDTIAENQWMAAFCMHTFGDSPDDLARTKKLAAVFAANQTPIIAAGHPFALGCASFATQPDPDDWTKTKDTDIGAALKALRESPDAAYLALAMPRVLMRLPYGKTTDPIAPFPFEEIESPDQHEQYLWASPAVLVARMYLERFKQKGWGMDLDAGETLGDIPVFHFKEKGESKMMPCAEAWLTERAAVAVSNAGFIPILSIKNSDSIRLGRINSISVDNAPLALRVPKN
ncbi:type VI secretion system protein ImpC [Ereboglobus sp. PH5-10]|uniref:type VI secretion system contractile sheath domain-containing protein n=1 Tax=Ereboglobus sp. PH5-10 TaxID=2940629 RepID=UPI0024072A7C|nr:type VI secretion system contractile sheath large subunit [Ereboglobus sp. PH5-10]MDF9826529.1 type VI secretion system protein ImpC [Ereboglobus sp. PH5-10]